MAIDDINGDGYDDLVTGDADYQMDGDYNSRAYVSYGSTDGFKEARQKLDQNMPGIPGVEEEGDLFGGSVAVGDVTGDGYADVAVGVVGEDVGTVTDAGSVVLLPGSDDGVTGAGAQGTTKTRRASRVSPRRTTRSGKRPRCSTSPVKATPTSPLPPCRRTRARVPCGLCAAPPRVQHALGPGSGRSTAVTATLAR